MSGPEKPSSPKETTEPKEYRPFTPEELAQKRAEQDAIWKKMEQREKATKLENATRVKQLQQDLGIKDAEQIRREIVEKALTEGGLRLHMSVPSDIAPHNRPGFANIETRAKNWDTVASSIQRIANTLRSGNSREQVVLDRELNQHGLSEIIDIRRKFKPEMASVVIPGKKGLFGIGSTPDQTERKMTGRDIQPMHDDLVADGKQEPAVKISYFADSRNLDREAMGWRDESGRFGQMLLFEIVVPESVGKEIERQVDKDPGFIRTLVEQAAKRTLKHADAWETPQGRGDSLRPPYERWDKGTGGRIYVQKEGEGLGWHDSNIRKVNRT